MEKWGNKFGEKENKTVQCLVCAYYTVSYPITLRQVGEGDSEKIVDII